MSWRSQHGYCKAMSTEQPGVYLIHNMRDGKVYVGSTGNISKRWSRHRKDLRAAKHPNRHLQAAWDYHGEASFEFVIAELTTDLTVREQHWMDATGCIDPALGYNKAPFARTTKGMTGKKRTPEFCAWQSANLKGKCGFGVAIPVLLGSDNHMAKLTDQDVRDIRRRYGPAVGNRKPHGGLTYAVLAQEYGVSQSVICEVVRGNAWTHVGEVMPNG